MSCRDCTPNILCGDSIIEAWWQIPRDKGAPFFHSPIASSRPAGSCNSKGRMPRRHAEVLAVSNDVGPSVSAGCACLVRNSSFPGECDSYPREHAAAISDGQWIEQKDSGKQSRTSANATISTKTASMTLRTERTAMLIAQ